MISNTALHFEHQNLAHLPSLHTRCSVHEKSDLYLGLKKKKKGMHIGTIMYAILRLNSAFHQML